MKYVGDYPLALLDESILVLFKYILVIKLSFGGIFTHPGFHSLYLRDSVYVYTFFFMRILLGFCLILGASAFSTAKCALHCHCLAQEVVARVECPGGICFKGDP